MSYGASQGVTQFRHIEVQRALAYSYNFQCYVGNGVATAYGSIATVDCSINILKSEGIRHGVVCHNLLDLPYVVPISLRGDFMEHDFLHRNSIQQAGIPSNVKLESSKSWVRRNVVNFDRDIESCIRDKRLIDY